MYSHNEYDRHQIDSLMYLKSFGQITHYQWIKALVEVNIYKQIEMSVHINSVNNTKFYKY